MKTSVLLFLTDILPEKRRLFNKIVKNKIFGSLPNEKVFTEMKKSGIEGIEVLLPKLITADDIHDLKEVMEANKMQVFSVHQALRFLTQTKLAEIKKLFDIAQLLSAEVIVLHMNSAGKQVLDPKYIAEIHKLEKNYGIKVGYENMEKHAGSLMSGIGWDGKKFGDLMKKNGFKITMDVCHIGQSGGDILNFLKLNMARIVNIHLSDYKSHYLNNSIRPMRFKHMPLGKGELPINEFLKILKNENYPGILTLEIETDLKGLLESAEIIKNAT
ncbi:MAG TPA: sugar phosphate isomerase/epimerase family protein [Xanthomonadales bacterium]|nr:sugar phosphate isomerase/epimerase family protein [Xanthomonadales bacterium]